MNCYRKDYPRPQLVRDGWESLNGIWDFAFDDANAGETAKERWYENFPAHRAIRVPFTYETKLSGIGDETPHENVWYRRVFTVQEDRLADRRLLVHFEGSDYVTKVWVNGRLAGVHTGGYARFSFDITALVRAGENILTVKAEDRADEGQPRGKQRWTGENFACWYVQTTGIWKTVWLEYVPQNAVHALKLTPDLQNAALEIECGLAYDGGEDLLLEAAVSFGGAPVTRVLTPITGRRLRLRADIFSSRVGEWGVRTWTPEHPDLYDLTVRVLRGGETLDEVYSYFGMREIRIDGANVLLNGAPLYQRLILDQGYWPDSHLTPPDEDALLEDIDKVLALGYNGVRKHQKTEDERFLYWCDVRGLLVWSEMAAAYAFSDDAVEAFTMQWMEIVRQNYNHPSIITWTPFNESWGVGSIKTARSQQHFTESIYALTKSFDPMRPVIVNDGWEHTVSDILTLHDYEQSGESLLARYRDHREEILSGALYHSLHKSALADGYAYRGQPVIISEYGGIALDNGESGWGYGSKAGDAEDFLRRFDELTTAVKQLPYVCGYCYTQVTDVQQEINGLMDARRAFKADPERIRAVNERPVGCVHAL